MNPHTKQNILIGAAGAVLILAAAVLGWFVFAPDRQTPPPVFVAELDSPATARLDRDMHDALRLLDSLERAGPEAEPPCQRCTYLAQTAGEYRQLAEAALGGIRQIERRLSRQAETPGDRLPAAERVTLERRLAARQRAAARAVAGLGSFSEAVAECRAERLCRTDDAERAADTRPFDCARDGGLVRRAAERIDLLAERIIDHARSCQTMSCPVMDCTRSADLAADLRIAEMSLAELTGGRTAWPGGGPLAPGSGLATVMGGVERALVGLAVASGEAALPAEEVAARARDVRSGLATWMAETERRKGVQKETWRVSALIAEIDVAAEWATRAGAPEYEKAFFEALSRAMLSAARLDAALATGEEQAQRAARPGPVCGVSGLAQAYLKIGDAIAALGFCRAKAACPAAGASAMRPPRSASDAAIGAFAAVTGALPLEPERADDAGVRQSRPPEITLNRQSFMSGEVVRVAANTAPSACLANDGAIGLAPAAAPLGREQRYQLSGNAQSEVLLAAPVDPGLYKVRVFAAPERGGQLLSQHDLRVEALPPGCTGFTGAWETQFGELRLVERGGTVSGSYRRTRSAPLPGLLLGDVSGRTLTGTWLSELGRGGTRLRLSESGNRFRGTWGVTPDRLDGGGRWDGDCLGGLH